MNFYILTIQKSIEVRCGVFHYFDNNKVMKEFQKIICSYIKLFDSTYLIVTSEEINNDSILELIRPYKYLLMKIDIKNKNGWLDQEHWNWINKYIKKEENYNG